MALFLDGSSILTGVIGLEIYFEPTLVPLLYRPLIIYFALFPGEETSVIEGFSFKVGTILPYSFKWYI